MEFTFTGDDGDFDLEVRNERGLVCHALGIRDGETVRIADLKVTSTYRRRGIGTELLTRFLNLADAAGVRTIWGIVTQADLDEFPKLLAWYKRFGFAIEEPDDSCPPLAIKQITRL